MARNVIANAGDTLPAFATRLVIGADSKELDVPVTSVSMTYRVVRSPGDIPNARVQLSSGYNPKSLAEYDALRVILDAHRISKSPAKIVFNMGSGAGDRVLFDGYVLGVSPVRTASSYGVLVMLTHWLSDLDGSSAYLSGFASSFPSEAIRPATSGMHKSGAIAGESPLLPTEHVKDIKLTEVWATFSDFVLRLLSYAPTSGSQLLDYSGLNLYGENVRGANALTRISGYCTFKGGITQVLQESAVLHMIQLAAYPDVGGVTLLEKVLSLCDSFGCMLAPGAEFAGVYPDGSFARASEVVDPRAILEPGEIALSEVTLGLNRDVRGCVLLGVAAQSAMGSLSFSDNKPIAAYYSTSRGGLEAGGNFIPAKCPQWLALILTPVANMYASVGKPGMCGRSRSTQKPPAGAQDPLQAARDARPVLQVLADDWARYAWGRAVTAGSSLRITGPLRFDIGPGTQVCLQMRSGSGIDLDQGEPHLFYGMVDSAEITIDAEGNMASTSFGLMGIRTPEDDKELGRAVPSMYTKYVSISPIAESTPDGY